MTNQTNTATVDEVQLYWDHQDPNNTGWYLRYHVDGTEDGESIDGDIDADTEELASEVAMALAHYGTVKATVFRGDEPRGQIVVDAGTVVSWRAA